MDHVIHTKLSGARRVAIPAELCRHYGIEPGDPIVLEPTSPGIVLRPFHAVIRDVQAYFADIAPPGVSLSEELIREAGRKPNGRPVAEAVLDASALLAFLQNEPGADKVEAVLTLRVHIRRQHGGNPQQAGPTRQPARSGDLSD